MSASTTPKETAIEIIRELPDDVSPQDIIAELCFRQEVQIGLNQLDQGEAVSHEEVKNRLAKWLG